MTEAVRPLAYDDGTAASGSRDLDVRFVDGRLVVTWPAESTVADRLFVASDVAFIIMYAAMAGLLPWVVSRLVGGTHPGVVWTFVPVVVVNGFFTAARLWTAVRYPRFRNRLTVYHGRLAYVRMGLWGPLIVDRSTADVTRLEWTQVRRPFRRRPDIWQLTVRFANGPPISTLVPAKDTQLPPAARSALAALIPGR